MSNLKYNINKLHGLLLNEFENVSIVEKSDYSIGNYFEISVKEDKEVKIILTKKDIESDNFNWSYYSNPLLENSSLVQRRSNISNITEDIKEIFTKNRFDEEYITKLSK